MSEKTTGSNDITSDLRGIFVWAIVIINSKNLVTKENKFFTKLVVW